ncbi:MAG: hypothetical protein AAFV71_14945 [Cyanobacteria bacterium J06633_8]
MSKYFQKALSRQVNFSYLLCAASIMLGIFSPSPTFSRPIPYRTLRYQKVIGQTEWYTCGPAAIATLLIYY